MTCIKTERSKLQPKAQVTAGDFHRSILEEMGFSPRYLFTYFYLPLTVMQWHTGVSPGWWRGGGFSHLGETQKSHTEYYRIRCHEPTVSRTRETLISNGQTGLTQPLQASLFRRRKPLITNPTSPSVSALKGKQTRVELLVPIPSRPAGYDMAFAWVGQGGLVLQAIASQTYL